MCSSLSSGQSGSVRTWLQRPASFLSHIVASLINNTNSRHLSAFAHNIPVMFFMPIKSGCFWSSGFNNGSFLARHAVSWQSTLLGPTADCAVLIINSADECRLCSPLIYFSLVYVHVGTCIFLCVHVVVTFMHACKLLYLSVTSLFAGYSVSVDSPLHSYAPRTSGPHTPWTCREKQSGLRKI